MIANLNIIDNLFPDPHDVRAFALSQDFSQAPTVDGHAYPGFSPIKDEAFGRYLTTWLAKAVGFDVHVKIACVVMGTTEETQQWIHADNPAANFAGVIYLFDKPGFGTAFWDHALGSGTLTDFVKGREGEAPADTSAMLQEHGKDQAWWTRTDYADSKFNRLIFYPTDRFHSRWPKQAFGTTPADSRLTISVFFDIVE